jgi:hypothetical protein
MLRRRITVHARRRSRDGREDAEGFQVQLLGGPCQGESVHT